MGNLLNIQDNVSHETLIEIMESKNPAELLDDKQKKTIANELIKAFEDDLESMVDWIGLVEKGQELMAQDFDSRSEPWEGAANFKSPLIMDAVLKFGDTASQELLRKREVVKAMTIGKDKDGVKSKQGERVSSYLNYQLNVKMKEWRCEHDKLLYTLPSTGCMFKKSFYDPNERKNVANVIFFPNFVTNQSNTTIDNANFTHILQFTQNEVIEKQRSGQWLDVDLIIDEDGRENQAEESEDRFLEFHGFFDLDGDGYKEPYAVTIHEATREILKIAPRFMPKDVNVKVKGEIFRLDVFLTAQKEGMKVEIEEIVSITPINLITKYDFLPDPVGEFLGIGYPHLLCGVAQAVNTTTNHLLDAGTLSNLPGGYLAKGIRKNLGDERFKPGEWKGTNVPARDFSNAFFSLPYGEPSQTLFALNEKMQQEGERSAANADFSKVLANNAPATTTLALLQEATQSTTSIIRRIYLSMSEEFRKLAMLTSIFGDEQEYKAVLDDQEADFKKDFDEAQFNLVPVANPEMSTRIERVKSAEVQMNFLPQIIEAGGQSQVVIRGLLDALGMENIDQIFPEPQQEQIDKQNQLKEQELKTQEFQNSLFDRELATRENDVQRKINETQSDMAETRAKIIKIKSETVLNFEKAETEDQKNRINRYTTELNGFLDLLSGLREERNVNNQSTTGENE